MFLPSSDRHLNRIEYMVPSAAKSSSQFLPTHSFRPAGEKPFISFRQLMLPFIQGFSLLGHHSMRTQNAAPVACYTRDFIDRGQNNALVGLEQMNLIFEHGNRG